MLSQSTPFTFQSNTYTVNTANLFQTAYLCKVKLLSSLQTTLGRAPIAINKTEQRKPIHILQNNLDCLTKRPFEEENLDSENFECHEKKMKSVEVLSSPSTQSGGSDDLRSPQKLHIISETQDLELGQIKSPVQSKNFLSMKEKNYEIEKEGKKIKVKEIVFDHKTNQVKFKVEFNKGSINRKVQSMTREEILREDPSLLLAFYESNLRFAKATEFNPSQLKTL